MGGPHDFGRLGEALAAAHLEARGWTILARNFRLGRNEVDLVARRGRVVAFIEVKSRSGPGFGHPLDAITRSKRREIERVARAWVARHGRPGDVYRFDAVAVVARAGRPQELVHVEDAWRADGGTPGGGFRY
ncbi:MAG: YraN family protein [Gemmatimonadetes bacterium]|nr:YraN family protein [Gemmatimonadota bacterium]